MNNIKCSDSEVVLSSSWCLCEMIWQNGCCRNNAFLCLPSQMINVLGSSQDFLPNADSANRRNGGFRCSLVTEGIKSPRLALLLCYECREVFLGRAALCLHLSLGCVAQGSIWPLPGAQGAAQRLGVATGRVSVSSANLLQFVAYTKSFSSGRR